MLLRKAVSRLVAALMFARVEAAAPPSLVYLVVPRLGAMRRAALSAARRQ